MSLDELFVGSAKFTSMLDPWPLYIALIHPDGDELFLKIADRSKLHNVSSHVLETYPHYVEAEHYRPPDATVTLEDARDVVLDFVGTPQAHFLGDCCYVEKMMWTNLLGPKNPFNYFVYEFPTVLDMLNIPLNTNRRHLASILGLGHFPDDVKHNSMMNARVLKGLWNELTAEHNNAGALASEKTYQLAGMDLKYGHLENGGASLFQIGLYTPDQQLFIYIPPSDETLVNQDVLERFVQYKKQARDHGAVIASPTQARYMVARFFDGTKCFLGDFGQQDAFHLLYSFKQPSWASGTMPINAPYHLVDLRTMLLLKGLYPDMDKGTILGQDESFHKPFNAFYQAQTTYTAYKTLDSGFHVN